MGKKVKKSSIRDWYVQMLLRQMYRPSPVSSESSVVFAPHQDDETLGCGGTIIQKRRAGVPVWILFITDGSRSHKHFMEREDLKSLRMQEARGAGQVLGVPEDQIQFLQFPNGELNQYKREAQVQVEAFFNQVRPNEVYIPSAWDFHFEHRETALIVMAAIAHLQQEGRLAHAPQVYEYPIWFWYQWPMVHLPADDPAERSRLLKRGLRYGFGMTFITQFRYAVSVCDVLDIKRDALAQYASQTTHLNQSADWATLQDIAGGEFIRFFFQDCEVFRKI